MLASTCSIDGLAEAGEVFARSALGLTLWLYTKQRYPSIQPFAAFCSLPLAAHSLFGGLGTQETAEVFQWVQTVEAKCRAVLGSGVPSDKWLLGLNAYVDSIDNRKKWLDAATRAFSRVSKISHGVRPLAHDVLLRLGAAGE